MRRLTVEDFDAAIDVLYVIIMPVWMWLACVVLFDALQWLIVGQHIFIGGLLIFLCRKPLIKIILGAL